MGGGPRPALSQFGRFTGCEVLERFRTRRELASACLYGVDGRGVFDAGHNGCAIPTKRGNGGVAAPEWRGFAACRHALLVYHAQKLGEADPGRLCRHQRTWELTG